MCVSVCVCVCVCVFECVGGGLSRSMYSVERDGTHTPVLLWESSDIIIAAQWVLSDLQSHGTASRPK